MTSKYILLFCLVALFTSDCTSKTEAMETKSIKTGPISVGSYKVRQHTFKRQIEIPADVLALKQVMLISKVPGEIKKMNVAEGDTVRKNDIVATLDQKDFRLAVRQAQAQLAAAKAGVNAAEIGLDTVTTKHGRLAQLRDKQVISQSAFEDIEGAQRSTQAQLMMAKSQVALAEVGLDAAKTNLSYTEIRAPFDGEVAKRLVDEGTRLNAMPPTPIALLVDASKLKIVGSVSERDLPYVSVGSPVIITIDALQDAPIEAKVDRVEPIVDPQSRTAGIQVLLDNAKGKMQPGMSARLTIDLGERSSVAVPDDVIIRSEIADDSGILFVVQNSKAERREVRLGNRQGDLREVTNGLKPGETVVRGGQEKLKEGQLVNVVKKTEGA